VSVVVQLTLPWGRFHATPWNRAANEGAVEWPPSPWRLLRALYNSWKVHHPHVSDRDVMEVLAALSAPPSYVLPPAVEAHTRHYLPSGDHREGFKNDTDKQLDSFVVTERNARMWVEWDVELSGHLSGVLSTLLDGVGYLGRAESLVDCEVVDRPGQGVRHAPLGDGASVAQEVRLLGFATDATEQLLTQTPSSVRSDKRLMPKGTIFVRYEAPPRHDVPRLSGPKHSHAPITAVRFALGTSVKPSRFDAVDYGHVFHAASVRRAVDSHGHSPVLTGRGRDNAPLHGRHEHAHYLLLPDRADHSAARSSSMVVWAPGGLTGQDVDALCSLRQLRSNYLGGLAVRPLTLVAIGTVDQVVPTLTGPSRIWESVTPYAPIHRYRRGSLSDQLLTDINKELTHRDLPHASSVEIVPGPWLRYRRYRSGREQIRHGRPAYGIRLHMVAELAGPLALGQLSHFGLGIFRPVGE
jgi:CRISPR-associated protein Csb2